MWKYVRKYNSTNKLPAYHQQTVASLKALLGWYSIPLSERLSGSHKYEIRQHCSKHFAERLQRHGGTAAAVPPPFRPSDPGFAVFCVYCLIIVCLICLCTICTFSTLIRWLGLLTCKNRLVYNPILCWRGRKNTAQLLKGVGFPVKSGIIRKQICRLDVNKVVIKCKLEVLLVYYSAVKYRQRLHWSWLEPIWRHQAGALTGLMFLGAGWSFTTTMTTSVVLATALRSASNTHLAFGLLVIITRSSVVAEARRVSGTLHWRLSLVVAWFSAISGIALHGLRQRSCSTSGPG